MRVPGEAQIKARRLIVLDTVERGAGLTGAPVTFRDLRAAARLHTGAIYDALNHWVREGKLIKCRGWLPAWAVEAVRGKYTELCTLPDSAMCNQEKQKHG